MERLEFRTVERGSVASVSVRVEGLTPEGVLAGGAGRARGLWARGERWVAHFGILAEVLVGEEESSVDRFRETWRRAAPYLRTAESAGAEGAVDGGPGPRPRFYGGFAFRDDDAPDDGAWRGFPRARFVLPAVEVRGEGRAAWLTVRAVREDGSVTTDEQLRAEAERLARELGDLSAPGRGGRGAGDRNVRPVEGDRSRWRAAVDEARRWIGGGRASKIVLARTLEVVPDEPADPARVALRLLRQNPGTHVFLFETAEGRALVGAAPETIATVTDGVLGATAVAGSISRGEAPEEQEALALRLLESDKDRAEHAIAVEDIVRRLRPLTSRLTWDSEPHVLTLSRIQHLETRIQARLKDGESALSVVCALHPTPAVCGLPREAALRFLRVEEPFERGWYAGPVGWFDDAGDGVFAPALRSGLWTGERWRLFAGAGIVEASDPDLEWDETGIKFEPMLHALEARGARPAARPDGDSLAEGSTAG